VLPTEIPPHLVEFIVLFVRSVEQLEILLLLHRERTHGWSAAAVYEKVLTSPQSVVHWLEEMTRSGLVRPSQDIPGEYQRIDDPPTADLVSQLDTCYQTSPVRVIELIYKRHPAVHSFADAFKINRPNSP
jgi:hypothetical protein